MSTTSETRMDWVRDIKLRMQAVNLAQEEADEIIAFIKHRVRTRPDTMIGTVVGRVLFELRGASITQEAADDIARCAQGCVRTQAKPSAGTAHIEVQVLNPDGLRDEVEQIFVDGVTRALSRISKP